MKSKTSSIASMLTLPPKTKIKCSAGLTPPKGVEMKDEKWKMIYGKLWEMCS